MSSTDRLERIRDVVFVQYGGHYREIHVYFIRRIAVVCGEHSINTYYQYAVFNISLMHCITSRVFSVDCYSCFFVRENIYSYGFLNLI